MPRDDGTAHGQAGQMRERAADAHARIADLAGDAVTCLPPKRAADLAAQLIAELPLRDRDDPSRLEEALGYALDLALFMPAPSGTTAADRFARRHKPSDAAEASALAALVQSRFRLLRAERREGPACWRMRDLASDESLLVHDEHLPADLDGMALAVRLCPLAGTHVMTGSRVPLDDAALAVAMDFIRPGRGLANPLRCAETVFRHALRHGVPAIPGLNLPPDDRVDAVEIDPIMALAELWVAGSEPSDEERQGVRAMASLATVLRALSGAEAARRSGQDRLGDAYLEIARLQIETIAYRSTIAGAPSLDAVAAAIDRAVALGMPAAVRDLFREIRGQLRAAPSDDADLDRLVQRIRALRAKTVEQGCTEAEAMAAAAKVAELLDRHGLSLSDVELQRQTCAGAGIETSRRRAGPIDDCVPAVAAFFDCRTWRETTPDGTLRHVLFGLPGDVAAAQYLYDLVDLAFETETVRFQATATYTELDAGGRRSATNSFRLGLARGICGKLCGLRQERERSLRSASGRDLVVAKAAVVDGELAKLGLSFRSAKASRRRVLADAYAAGQEAGAGFDYRPALAARA